MWPRCAANAAAAERRPSHGRPPDGGVPHGRKPRGIRGGGTNRLQHTRLRGRRPRRVLLSGRLWPLPVVRYRPSVSCTLGATILSGARPHDPPASGSTPSTVSAWIRCRASPPSVSTRWSRLCPRSWRLALTANRQPPTANRQPPTANRQPPTANRQPPTAKKAELV
jgi:hypothetical protein